MGATTFFARSRLRRGAGNAPGVVPWGQGVSRARVSRFLRLRDARDSQNLEFQTRFRSSGPCESGHVPAWISRIPVRPPHNDRGNEFFDAFSSQKAGHMWVFGGAQDANEAFESRNGALHSRFRFQGSQRRFLALSGKRAFGAIIITILSWK